MENIELVWHTLVSRGRTTDNRSIRDTARLVGLNPEHTVRALRTSGRIEPLFKGQYFVKNADEILHQKMLNPLKLFTWAAKAKDIGSWYFGLETALRLCGLSHEYTTEEHVVSDSFYRPNGLSIGGHRFVILKWKSEMTRFGLKKTAGFVHSDPTKTVLDLAYRDAHRVHRGKPAREEWREHIDRVDPNRLTGYLKHYPPVVRQLIEGGE